jgi:hypothetical protein
MAQEPPQPGWGPPPQDKEPRAPSQWGVPPPPQPRPDRPWYKRERIIIPVAAFVLVSLLGLAGLVARPPTPTANTPAPPAASTPPPHPRRRLRPLPRLQQRPHRRRRGQQRLDRLRRPESLRRRTGRQHLFARLEPRPHRRCAERRTTHTATTSVGVAGSSPVHQPISASTSSASPTSITGVGTWWSATTPCTACPAAGRVPVPITTASGVRSTAEPPPAQMAARHWSRRGPGGTPWIVRVIGRLLLTAMHGPTEPPR